MNYRDLVNTHLENTMRGLPLKSDGELSQADCILMLENSDIEFVTSTKTLKISFDDLELYNVIFKRITTHKKNLFINIFSMLFKSKIEQLDIVSRYIGPDIIKQLQYTEVSNTSYTISVDRSMTFPAYIKDDNNDRAYDKCYRGITGEGGFVLIVGGYGSGKTHLASACINQVLDTEMRNTKVTFFMKPKDFFFLITEAAKKNAVEELKHRLMYADLLVIDDFQQCLEKDNPFFYEILFDVIDHRYSTYKTDLHTTILTSHDVPNLYKSDMSDMKNLDNPKFLKYYSVENYGNKYTKYPRQQLTGRLIEHMCMIEDPSTDVKLRFVNQIFSNEGIEITSLSREEQELYRQIITGVKGTYRELKQVASSFVFNFQKYGRSSSNMEILEKVMMAFSDSLLGIDHIIKTDMIVIENRASRLYKAIGVFKDQLLDIQKGTPQELYISRSAIIFTLFNTHKFSQGQIGELFHIKKSRVSQILSEVRREMSEGNIIYTDMIETLTKVYAE